MTDDEFKQRAEDIINKTLAYAQRGEGHRRYVAILLLLALAKAYKEKL